MTVKHKIRIEMLYNIHCKDNKLNIVKSSLSNPFNTMCNNSWAQNSLLIEKPSDGLHILYENSAMRSKTNMNPQIDFVVINLQHTLH